MQCSVRGARLDEDSRKTDHHRFELGCAIDLVDSVAGEESVRHDSCYAERSFLHQSATRAEQREENRGTNGCERPFLPYANYVVIVCHKMSQDISLSCPGVDPYFVAAIQSVPHVSAMSSTTMACRPSTCPTSVMLATSLAFYEKHDRP